MWFMSLIIFAVSGTQVTDQMGKIHRVYSEGGEIYYQVFDGAEWDEPLNLSNSPKDRSYEPRIEIEGEIVTVEWNEEHNGKVYRIRTRKLLGYERWSLPENIEENPLERKDGK